MRGSNNCHLIFTAMSRPEKTTTNHGLRVPSAVESLIADAVEHIVGPHTPGMSESRLASDLHLYTQTKRVMERRDGMIRRPAVDLAEIFDLPAESLAAMAQHAEEVFAFGGGVLNWAMEAHGWRLRVQTQTVAKRWLEFKVRRLPRTIPPDLRLPAAFIEKVKAPRGLVLVAGATGSGKSTTLAAAIRHHIPQHSHIITYENPVEIRHEFGPTDERTIAQYEQGVDFNEFGPAVEESLRKDFDVMVIAEMREAAAIRSAIVGADTGHLVMGTLHTSTGPTTINRVIEGLGAGSEQAIYRDMFARSLLVVLNQTLVPAASGGRIAAFELLLGTSTITSLIASGAIAQIEGAVTGDGLRDGMFSMEHSLVFLAEKKLITRETAFSYAPRPSAITQRWAVLAEQAGSPQMARMRELYLNSQSAPPAR